MANQATITRRNTLLGASTVAATSALATALPIGLAATPANAQTTPQVSGSPYKFEGGFPTADTVRHNTSLAFVASVILRRAAVDCYKQWPRIGGTQGDGRSRCRESRTASVPVNVLETCPTRRPGKATCRKPITGIAGCCARAAHGHVAAAPPRSVMNSRRFIMRISPPACSLNTSSLGLKSSISIGGRAGRITLSNHGPDVCTWH